MRPLRRTLCHVRRAMVGSDQHISDSASRNRLLVCYRGPQSDKSRYFFSTARNFPNFWRTITLAYCHHNQIVAAGLVLPWHDASAVLKLDKHTVRAHVEGRSEDAMAQARASTPPQQV
eukprot:COSAG01_NODE_1555_length_9928_cov_20.399837_9_plen_118_part_00